MLLTPHTAAGIAIASVLPEPQLAVPLSFLSHFVLDSIPHWDSLGLKLTGGNPKPLPLASKQFQIILLDALLSLTLGFFLFYRALPDYGVGTTILLSAVSANLPDMFYIPRVFFGKTWGWVSWMIRFQHIIQTHSRAPFVIGILTQVATVAICLLIALR